MINIYSCIEKRKKYPIEKAKFDAWVDEIIHQDTQNSVFFIVPEGFLFSALNQQREVFDSKYCVAGVFDMGAPYLNTGISMTLIYAVPYQVSEMKVGIFSGAVFDRKKYEARIGGEYLSPEEYYAEFDEYISMIESWVENDSIPSGKEGRYEFNSVVMEEVDCQKRYPKYYSKKALEIRRLLANEKAVLLSEVANIIKVKEERRSQTYVKRIRMVDLKYPLDIKAIQVARPTNVILQRGDILFPAMGNATPYLYNEYSDEPVYAGPNAVVIRCRGILPEYMYLYLISETAKTILESVTKNGVVRSILVHNLAELPVVLPVFDKQKYISDFEVLTNLWTRQYNIQTGDFDSYYIRLKNIVENKTEA